MKPFFISFGQTSFDEHLKSGQEGGELGGGKKQ